MQSNIGGELGFNREEHVPINKKESLNGGDNSNPNTGARKIHIKGHRPHNPNAEENKESNENLTISHPENSDIRNLVHTEHNGEPQPREDRPVPKKNNLIQSNPEERNMSASPSLANITGAHGDSQGANNSQIMKSGELPPVKSGKVPIRRTFKPAQVKEQDFEGM